MVELCYRESSLDKVHTRMGVQMFTRTGPMYYSISIITIIITRIAQPRTYQYGMTGITLCTP